MVYIVYMGEEQTSPLTNTQRIQSMSANYQSAHRLNAQQTRQFEAALQQAQAQSFVFTDANLRRLQAQSDAYYLSLR